jgi:ribosomal protein L2
LQQNNIIGKALLLGHSMELGVVFINGSVMNSGEHPLLGGDDRERLRGMEMAEDITRV